MPKKKKNNKNIMILVGLALLVAVFYLFISAGGKGVLVSCESNEIISIKDVPPPLMAMAQPKICEVNLTVKTSAGDMICEEVLGVFNTERNVLACSGLDKHIGETVLIDAIFYDTEGNRKGTDRKNVQVS